MPKRPTSNDACRLHNLNNKTKTLIKGLKSKRIVQTPEEGEAFLKYLIINPLHVEESTVYEYAKTLEEVGINTPNTSALMKYWTEVVKKQAVRIE